MTETVVEVLDISKHISLRRCQDMSSEFLRGGFAGASGNRNNRPIPFQINSVCQALKGQNHIIDENKLVAVFFEVVFVFFVSIRSQHACNGAFFESRSSIYGGVFEFTVKPIILIFR